MARVSPSVDRPGPYSGAARPFEVEHVERTLARLDLCIVGLRIAKVLERGDPGHRQRDDSGVRPGAVVKGHRGRVAFVCQWYAPEPVTQPGWMVDALVEQGFDVEVLTGVPNYPTGVIRDGYTCWRRRRELVDGVWVTRTPLYPSHDGSASKRMLNYLTWGISSALLGHRVVRGADVSLVYGSPITAACAAVLGRVFGTPYVLLVQDIWPDSIFASGFLSRRSDRVRRAMEWLVGRIYRLASAIVVISPGMKHLLHDRGVPAEKVAVVYNWVDDNPTIDLDAPDLRSLLGIESNRRIVLYAGNLGPAQGLDLLIHATGEVASDAPALVFVGAGMAENQLREVARAVAPDRCHFLGSVSAARVEAWRSQADFTVVSLNPDPLFEVTVPSKLQAGLAAGVPLLVVAQGDAARICREAHAGLVAPPGDVHGIAEALAAVTRVTPAQLAEFGASGRAYYLSVMGRSVGAAAFAAILEQEASRGAGT